MALSPVQLDKLVNAYLADAGRRGVDMPGGMIRELLQLLLQPKTVQQNQLQSMVQRAVDTNTTAQQNFAAQTAAAQTRLTTEGSDLTDLATAVQNA